MRRLKEIKKGKYLVVSYTVGPQKYFFFFSIFTKDLALTWSKTLNYTFCNGDNME